MLVLAMFGENPIFFHREIKNIYLNVKTIN